MTNPLSRWQAKGAVTGQRPFCVWIGLLLLFLSHSVYGFFPTDIRITSEEPMRDQRGTLFLLVDTGSIIQGFLRDRIHSINSCFTSGYSKAMPIATNAVATKSQKKSDWALFSSAFLAGDSSADDEVCKMRTNWHKLLVFMAIIGLLIGGDAIRSWRRK